MRFGRVRCSVYVGRDVGCGVGAKRAFNLMALRDNLGSCVDGRLPK